MEHYQREYLGYQIWKIFHQSVKRPGYAVKQGDRHVATVFSWDEVVLAVERDSAPPKSREAPGSHRGFVGID